ncbi:3,4-dihydroxy-2-butanone-4-phosphate synthase [Blastococcus sp. SYSU D00820]
MARTGIERALGGPHRRATRVDRAIQEVRAGRMVVICEGEDRDSRGHLVALADLVTPVVVNFMAREGRGLVCLAMTSRRSDAMCLDLAAPDDRRPHGPGVGVSIDARSGITTGMSAADRARTIRVAVHPASAPSDLVRPGHVFPLLAADGGVLVRPGPTEAAVDLARLAGAVPASVTCAVLNDDGSMARRADLAAYCGRHGLEMITVADLVAHRRRNDELVQRIVSTALPTSAGGFTAVGYRSVIDGGQHLALVKGQVSGGSAVLVRVHKPCLTGDVFHSLRCDCREQLDSSMSHIEQEGAGVVIHVAPEGRSGGILDQLRAYGEQGHPAPAGRPDPDWPMDERGLAIAARILDDLGVSSVRLLTDDPEQAHVLEDHGVTVSRGRSALAGAPDRLGGAGRPGKGGRDR